jgi:hypothetical protein
MSSIGDGGKNCRCLCFTSLHRGPHQQLLPSLLTFVVVLPHHMSPVSPVSHTAAGHPSSRSAFDVPLLTPRDIMPQTAKLRDATLSNPLRDLATAAVCTEARLCAKLALQIKISSLDVRTRMAMRLPTRRPHQRLRHCLRSLNAKWARTLGRISTTMSAFLSPRPLK